MSKDPLAELLSEPVRTYVAERVRDGAYASAGDYLTDLVQRDRAAQAAQRLRGLIEEGLASGPPRALAEADWAELRQSALRPGA